jgi:hypothetical protein
MNQVFDRWALVLNYQASLFRLALVLTGDPKQAGRLLEKAFETVSPNSNEIEADLLRALILCAPESAKSDFEIGPSLGLNQHQAKQLVDLIASLPLRERAVVGLFYVRGLTLEELVPLLPSAKRSPAPNLTQVREILARFRAKVCVALYPQANEVEILSDIDYLLDGYLSEEAATELRQVLFARPELLQSRDQLKRVRSILQQYLPSLYSLIMPNEVHERLYNRFAMLDPVEPVSKGAWLARFGMIAAVFALIAGLMFWPNSAASLASEQAPENEDRSISVSLLLQKSLQRFEYLPLEQGILHERFEIYNSSIPSYQIERWYDLASPHRLRSNVSYLATAEQAAASLVEYASNGIDSVQVHRNWYAGEGTSYDATVSQAEAQNAIKYLRSQPHESSLFNSYEQFYDISLGYLVQARERNASFMGRTLLNGREAYRLLYSTPLLPDEPSDIESDQIWQVLLTLDSQTLSVLDITVIGNQQGEYTSEQVLKMVEFEVLNEVDESLWQLEPSNLAISRQGLTSLLVPMIPAEQVIGLEDAMQRVAQPMYVPQKLPSPMKATMIALGNDDSLDVLQLYEGAYQGLAIVRASLLGYQSASLLEGEYTENGLRYRFISPYEFPGAQSAALVYLDDGSNDVLLVLLIDPFSSVSQRQAIISNTIAGLTVLSGENITQIQQTFLTP